MMLFRVILIFGILFCSFKGKGQSINIDSLLNALKCDCDSVEGEDPILLKIAEPAQFPGGDSALHKYLTNEACKKGSMLKQSKVHVLELAFKVDSTGSIKGPVSILWNTAKDKEMDKNIRLAVQSMPIWHPRFLLKNGKRLAETESMMIVIDRCYLIMKYRDRIWREKD